MRRVFIAIVIAGLTMLSGYASFNLAEAATTTVSSLSDDGSPGTLRHAITNAAHGDTIDFSVSGTIALASDLPDIDKRLIIDGTGQSVTVQGSTGVRSGFTLIDGADLTVRSLTFDGADLTTGTTNGRNNGAAIFAAAGSMTPITATFPIKLVVEDSTFTDNSAAGVTNNSLNSRGGAIYLDRVHATISNSEFDSNSALHGGLSSAAGDGGAIYADESVLLVDNSTFDNNVAGESGGAIYVTNLLEFTVTDSTFTSNDANGTGTSDGGGAIFIHSLQNGSATSISGVPPVITGSYFRGNTSDSDGGAIRIQPRGIMIHNSTFYQNTAADTGGAIYAWGAQLSHITAASNTATTRGGGVFLIFSDTRVDNSILGSNTPDDCAASSSDFILVRDSLVDRNSPEIDGEIDYNCNVEAANGNIDDRPRLDAPADNGGSTFTMKLQDPSGTSQDSKAIDAGNPATCSVADQRGRLRTGGMCDMGAYELNSTVNCAAHDGTTEYFSADSSALQNAINSATNGGSVKVAGTCLGGATNDGTIQTAYINKSITLQGGHHPISWTASADPVNNVTTLDAAGVGRAVRITGGHTVELSGMTIQNGWAIGLSSAGRGAGIYQEDDGTLELNQLTVQNNVSANGGGLYLSADSSVDIFDSTFDGNHVIGRGAGINANNAQVNVARSTFSNNHADSAGGGFYVSGLNKTVQINNSTISGNYALRGAAIRTDSNTIDLLLNHVSIVNNEGTITGTAVNDSVIGNRGVMTMTNSIVAYTIGENSCLNIDDGISSSMVINSWIEDGSCGVSNNVNGNKTGDPQLYLLAFDNDRGSFELDENGALTKSHALQSGSNAIGAGSGTYCTATDQLGFARPSGNCDMGARENVELNVPTAVAVRGQSAAGSGPWAVWRVAAILLAMVSFVFLRKRVV